EAERDLFERRSENTGGERFVQEGAIGREQGRDAVAMAILDTLENALVHERLAQAAEHHVLGGSAGFTHQPIEDLGSHIRFWLLVRLTRAHGTVEIALGCGLDDIFDGESAQARAARKVSPQKLSPVPGPHRIIFIVGMKVAITGASGLIGRRLVQVIPDHERMVLRRRGLEWDLEEVEGADAVIHLAGEPVAQRWTARAKARIRDSRVIGTRNLVSAF